MPPADLGDGGDSSAGGASGDTGMVGKAGGAGHDPRCIAVGEIGLDYYHADNPDIATQQAAFIAQMKIAVAARKPITIHCRTSELATPVAKAKYEPADAWEDLLALIAEHWTPSGLPGIMHCFSGNEEQARRSLDAGSLSVVCGECDLSQIHGDPGGREVCTCGPDSRRNGRAVSRADSPARAEE